MIWTVGGEAMMWQPGRGWQQWWGVMGLLLTLTGCAHVGYFASIEISATPTAIPGQFVVSGTTTLPPDSRMVVDALRYLDFPGQPSDLPVFAVLDTQETVITPQFQWQVILNTAPSGKEVWQKRYADVTPPVRTLSDDIVFRATWLPDPQPKRIQEMIGGQGQELRGVQLLNTGQMQFVRVYFPLAATVPDQAPMPTPTTDPMMKWRVKNDPVIYHRYDFR